MRTLTTTPVHTGADRNKNSMWKLTHGFSDQQEKRGAEVHGIPSFFNIIIGKFQCGTNISPVKTNILR